MLWRQAQPRIGTEINFSDRQWLGELGDTLAHQIGTVLEDFARAGTEFFAHRRGTLIEREVTSGSLAWNK